MPELNLTQCREIIFAEEINIQQIYDNLAAIVSTLKENTGKNRELRFNIGGSNNEWERLGGIALQIDPRMSIQVYWTWYETLFEYQEEDPRGRIHKGLPLHNLGHSYMRMGQRSLSKKYIQLAVIEDIISDHENWRDRPGYRFLRNIYAIPDDELDFLQGVVEQDRDNEDIFYPEALLLAFEIQREYNITRDIERNIFRVNLKYINKLLLRLEQAGRNSWRIFELLCAYLFSSIDGFEIVGKNVGTADYEIDLLLKNSITEDPTFASFGKYILVECKKWKKPVDVAQINHFLSKIRFHYASCGIMVAEKGISGRRRTKKIRDAELTILKAFHQDNIILMVLTLEDLRNVASGQNMASILIKEYEKIKFDRRVR